MSRPVGLEGRALVGLGVRMAVGLVLLVAGWLGARGQVALDRQAPWIALAVAGVLVASTAGAVWLLGVRREVTARTLALVAAVSALDAVPLAVAAADAAIDGAARAEGSDPVRVRRRGRGVRLFHRPGCELVAARAVVAGDAARWRADGLEPCEACGA